MKIDASECIPIEYIKDQIEGYRKFDHLGMYAEFLDMFIQDYKDNAMANYADRKTEPQTCDTCRHFWECIAKGFQCERTKCQGYEPKTEPQTDCSWK